MHLDTVITWLSYLGIFAFAISGFSTAANKKLDLFGAIIIALVTALGGGTLRDLLLNDTPSWISNTTGMYIAIAGGICAYVLNTHMLKIRKTLFLFDTIGISLFTISGLQIAQSHDISGFLLVIFGVISATFGGVIRDTLCNEIPLIFRKEVYATACIIGALVYLGLEYLEFNLVLKTIISCLVIIAIRTWAVMKKYRIPVLNEKVE